MTQVSDWCPTSATNGWGPVEYDQSNGENAANDGRTLSINGVTYPHGLGVHAASDVRFDLAGDCSSFSASVGIDDETNGSGSVVFQVWGDGAMLYQSPTKTGGQAATAVNVNVSGVSTLRLVVNDGGNGNGHDHGNWAAAQLSCAPTVDLGCGGSGTGGAGTGGTGSGGAGSGGAGSGGAGSGGAGSGGASGTGGNSGGSTLADAWPCNGSTAGYDYVVAGSNGSYTVNGSGNYSYVNALTNALGSGGASASNKRRILVQASGNISGAAQVRIHSNTVFNVCGTVHVTNDVSGSDRSPAYGRDASNIDIPHYNLTGYAQYGMFFRNVSNLHFGDIHINGTGGHGMRIDSRQSNGSFNRAQSRNVRLDYARLENTGRDGVEFYGVDGIEVGTVIARNTGDNGLILNDSINVNIDLMDVVDAAGGNTYAAFRTANNNGRMSNGTYPTNIRVRRLLASGSNSGRGFFCVTQSGGLEIENFTVTNVGADPAIFIENCHNVNMATSSGSGTLTGGRIYLGHNSGNGVASTNVTLRNITLVGATVQSASAVTCANNNQAINVTGGSVTVCH